MTFTLLLLCYVSANLASVSLAHSADLPSVIPAKRICKSGPPLKRTPGKINCLVIGDSISIGYIPWVADSLGDGYQVQNAPWGDFDGGALDSKYGLKCLQMFLSTVMLEPTSYDVIIFNFGLHDLNFNGKWPEEQTAPNKYGENLREIKSLLLSTEARVGYVLTTPMLYDDTLNSGIKQYNGIANHVMKEYPAIATADLYSWVIEGCRKYCLVIDKGLSPHFTKEGYKYLSEKVKDLVLNLAQSFSSNNSKIGNLDQNVSRLTQAQDENTRYGTRQSLLIPGKPSVPCRNMFGEVVQVCPYNSTCCNVPYTPTGRGCCLTPHAVPCGDGKHCCPAGFSCEPNRSPRKKCFCRKK